MLILTQSGSYIFGMYEKIFFPPSPRPTIHTAHTVQLIVSMRSIRKN